MTHLTLTDLVVPGDLRPRLDRVDLRVEPGELLVAIGPNGAGKSTLLLALTGQIGATSGHIHIGERPLHTLSRADRAAALAWLPQHPRIEEGLTAVEVVAAARFRHREPWRRALQVAREHLADLGAEQWADRRMTTLSGGEAQRVRLASLSAQEAHWWLLDEPGNHLDPSVRLEVLHTVGRRIRAGGGVVLVTHDIGALAHLPRARVLGLADGRAVLDSFSDAPDLASRAGDLLDLDLRRTPIAGAQRWVVVGPRSTRALARRGGVPEHGAATSDPPPRVDASPPPTASPRRAPSPDDPSTADDAPPSPPASRTALGAALVVVFAIVALASAPWIGPSLSAPTGGFVLTELRLPRALLGAIVGGTLGLVGAAFQTVLENPLATPSTIGTTAGASLGALAILVLWPAAAIGAPGVAMGAFVGALLVSLGIASLATLRRFRTEELLLAGIAISLGAGAAITGLQMQADAAATLASVRWSLGSLSIVGYEHPLALLPLALVGAAGVLLHQRALQGMAAGADRAGTQGIDVVRVRTLVLGAGSLAVAGCVAAAGPIAFIGLVVPHLVRLATGGGPRRLLVLSLVAGAGFLPLADGLARVVWPGRELPVGVLTAALGAPTLLILLWRRSPR